MGSNPGGSQIDRLIATGLLCHSDGLFCQHRSLIDHNRCLGIMIVNNCAASRQVAICIKFNIRI